MSGGFPNRPTRSAFGPKPINRRPIEDPAKEFDADVGDLAFWQVAGLGLVSSRAWVVVDAAGALVAHNECWSAGTPFTAPTSTRIGSGHFQVVFPRIIPDKNGISQGLNLIAGIACAQGATALATSVDVNVDGYTVDVHLIADAKFMLLVW